MATERMTAIVGARITEFRRKMAEVNKTMRKTATNVVVNVVARTDKAQDRLDRIARTINTISTVGRNMMQGSLVAISPSAIPILTSIIGALAALGPMIGVLGGSAFALGTAFAFAGTAALAFGAVAIPTISKLFDETAKLTKAQKAAKAEFNKVGKTWKKITKDLEKPVLQAFSEAMRITNKTLQMARPLFDSAAKAVNNLLKSLNVSLDSASIKAFFDYMNKEAGPLLETIGKAGGNFVKGFMSMMVAFGPLAKSTAQGFLEMSQGFAKWAEGLTKSEKFQSFVNYIKENMPKLKSIFTDATAGLVYMFSAFGPLSSDMMTGLQDLMARFKEWGKSLSENQQFQKFIGYIRENAPKVMTLIGNLADLIVNLGVALGPMGSKILDVVNGFLEWTNKMMESHPWIGKIVAVMVVLTGALMAIGPTIITFQTLFSGAAKAIWVATGMMRAKFITGMGMMVKSMITTTAKMIATSATFVAKWALIGAKSALNAAKVAASWVITTGTAMVTALASMAATTATFVAKWALIGTKAALNAGKVAGAWVLTTGASMVTALASMVATSAKFVAKWVWMGTQALLQAARMAAAWLIAMGPIGWVILAVAALVALIIVYWDEIKAWTIKTWNKVWSWIKETWEKIKAGTTAAAKAVWSAVKNKFSDMYNAVKDKMNDAWNKIKEIWGKVTSFFEGIDLSEIGKDIIMGLINGIGSMASSLIKKVKGVVGDAVAAAKNLLGINSPSRVFMEIGKFTGEGLSIGMMKTASMVKNAAAQMAGASLSPQGFDFNPALAGGAIGGSFEHTMKSTTPSRYESKSKENVGVAIVEALNGLVLENKIVVNEKEIIEATGKPMMRYIDKETKGAGTRKGQRR